MYGTGIIRGLRITLKNLLLPSRMFTLHQYPDRKVGILWLAQNADINPLKYVLANPGKSIRAIIGLETVEDRQPKHPRFRGEEFTWYEQRCTGCASCAKYCPLGIIRIVTEPSGNAMPEGEKYGIEVFDIDIGRCMFCGLCVEACPYDALHLGSGFEEGTYKREELVIDIDQLRKSPKKPSTWFRPQLEEKSYDPGIGRDVDWTEAGRHESPSSDDQAAKWAKR